MNWKNLLIILIISCKDLYCQNLVENGSFETFNRHISFMHFGTDTVFPKYWESSISFGSPDFYRKNSLDKRLDVPNNWYGYHPAKEGDAYIGLYPICLDGTTEHILGKFKTPLKEGTKYRFTLNLRFAGNCCAFYVNKIEIMFVEDSEILTDRDGFLYEKFSRISDNPQILLEDKNILQDTSWILFEKDVLVNKPYRYFVIGIFHQHENHLKLIKQINNYRSIRQKNINNKKIALPLMLNPNLNFRFDCTKHGIIEPYYFFDDISLVKIKDD